MPAAQRRSQGTIHNGQPSWNSMVPFDHLARPKSRAKPGSSGEGKFYRVVLRPKGQFVMFRLQDVGKKGHAERLAGKRASGSWDTQAWLISKEDAHVENGKLVGDEPGVKKILATLSTTPTHVEGDIFEAKDRKNVPEREKPTPAQRRARAKNIAKARRSRS